MNNLIIVILAAGKGTRMKSDLPKVCHKIGDKTMIEHVVNTSTNLNPKEIVVVVSKENIEIIKKTLSDAGLSVRFKIQEQQLGTAHGVLSAVPCCNNQNDLLVLLGDVPLISTDTLKEITNTNYDAVIVGFKDKNKKNKFGRIVVKYSYLDRNNYVSRIVEYNEATDSEKAIELCNSGLLWLKSTHVPLLSYITNKNSKGEYYLTDIVSIMVNKGLSIGFLEAKIEECIGVNTKQDLKTANKFYKKLNKVNKVGK